MSEQTSFSHRDHAGLARPAGFGQKRPLAYQITSIYLPVKLLKKMDHVTAQKLMATYGRIGEALSEANGIIRSLPEKEQTPHLHGLGDMMGNLWLKLQLPVVREYRDLDPDGDRFRKDLNK